MALLSDPLLSSLEPLQLHKLSLLNREHKTVIDTYRATKTSYEATQGLPWRLEEHLYSFYPSVTHLTVHVGEIDNLRMYLTPSVTSLHLILHLSVDYDVETQELFLGAGFSQRVQESFDRLLSYCQLTPSCSLKHLTMSFDPCVSINYTVADAISVGYDVDGPIYEDKDYMHKTSQFPPHLYISYIDHGLQALHPSDVAHQLYAEFLQALWRLGDGYEWKTITLPYALPGSTNVFGARWTGKEPRYCTHDELDELAEVLYGLPALKSY